METDAQMSNDRPHRILVIDDLPAIHEDFRKILCTDRKSSSKVEALEAKLFPSARPLGKQRHFRVDSAFQATEGLAKVYHALQENYPYEMAFVDVRMPPGLDGIEITPMLWKADPTLQIIICTAYSDYSWEEMFDRLGTSDRMFILKKPFDRMEILQLAHTLVAGHPPPREAGKELSPPDISVQQRLKRLEATSKKIQAEISRLQKNPRLH